tara:strand:+ start:91 stop:438 length:348 start_codon:yes stop_codon:yes gene_type:complete
MKQVTASEIYNLMVRGQTAFLLFKSDGCYLCGGLMPHMKKLIKKYKDINFYFIDVDDEASGANAFEDYIDGVPSIILITKKHFIPLKDPESPDDNSWYDYDFLDRAIKENLQEYK